MRLRPARSLSMPPLSPEEQASRGLFSARRFAQPLSLALSGLALLLVLSCTDTPDPTPSPSPTPPSGPLDQDQDGYTTESGDCDDLDRHSYPGAEEAPYDGIDQDCDGEDLVDVDGDGYVGSFVGGDDCDDKDASIHPDATEVGDKIDNDCDGEVDEGLDTVDHDGDGYSEATGDCDDLDWHSYPGAEEIPYDGIDQDCQDGDLIDVDGDGAQGGPEGTDCDDTLSAVYPDASEVPYDGIDQDCDGQDLTDVDEDGVDGGPAGTDCDDQDPSRAPGLTELAYDDIDQDCDGLDLTDVDEDGVDGGPDGEDCDDEDPARAPGLMEVPYDGIDQDCDGEDLTDVDGDGVASSQVTGGKDCDDEDVHTYPGAPEYADSKDNDCDGKIDEDLDVTDDDGDGYSESTGDCDDQNKAIHPAAEEVPYNGVDEDCSGADLTDVDGDGYASDKVEGGTDCNDASSAVNPGASEGAYDGMDQDCDGGDLTDVDGDGYASSLVSGGEDCDDASSLVYPGATEVPYDGIDQDCLKGDLTDVDGDGDAAQISGGGDCQDADNSISSLADEVCDGVDNNCDNAVDVDAVDAPTWYLDGDHDGYGDAATPVRSCEKTDSLADNDEDCADSSADIFPGAEEGCNGLDDNCDGTIDEGVTSTFYLDRDHDGLGDENATTQACTVPDGYVSQAGDCNDRNDDIYPGAPELCNSRDDDCDGQMDEGVVVLTWYKDGDGDGYGVSSSSLQSCATPAGYVNNAGDCNDSDATIRPGATEVCDGKDQDCDGTADDGVQSLWFKDGDSDGFGNASISQQACAQPVGFVANATDCDDARGTIYPGAPESCNGLDDDCDGKADDGVTLTFYRDGDGDGYGVSGTTTQACTAPEGYVASSTDCDDSKAAVNPGASESCNGVDDDCDAQVDEGVLNTYYLDADGDGYGISSVTTKGCAVSAGYAVASGDCNDGSSAVRPGAAESLNGVDDDCDGQVDEGVYLASCKDIKAAVSGAVDGIFTIDPDGTTGSMQPFQVYCDMTTDGGGWTFLATITNNGDGANVGSWLHTSPTPNRWENATDSFGTLDPSLNQDVRSLAFHSVRGSALMVTHRNQFLLRTDASCMGAKSLRERMVGLNWSCGGSADLSGAPPCANACVIAASTPRTGDSAVLAGASRSRLFFKAGEAEGAQDVNKDRVYLSTEYRGNVDYPAGLGAFCSGSYCSPRTGEADVNDRSDAITPTAGTEFYGVWIR